MIGTGFIRRLTHDARTASEVAIVRPAYAAGFRAAIATVVPLLFTQLLPNGGASWMSLAGLNGAIIDRGGPYRTRALMLSALALASGVAMVVGSLVGGHLVLSAVVTFVVAMLCGLARAWIDVGPGFGVIILVTYGIAVGLPVHSLTAALIRGGFIVAGGAWAMALALFLWPIRPYRPVRLRIAECYRGLARYLEAASDELESARPFDSMSVRPHLVAERAAIESARMSLAVLRRGRPSETARGERLLVMHEIADQMFVHVLALLEETDTIATSGARPALATVLGHIASTAREVAAATESETDVPHIQVGWNGGAIRPASPSIAEMVDRLADYATTAAAIVSSLNSGAPHPATADNIDVSEPPHEPVLFSLQAVMRPSSVVLHHALRVAIVTTLAVMIAELLGLNHGYWITLTVIVILQPYAATTRQKALQRVGGTILGATVAAGLTALLHGTSGLLVVIAVFTMACVALLPLNYGAYAVFGTPAFVLLAEMSASNWHLAGTRIVNTLIGGALALAGAQLLWPGDERNRLPEFAAAAIRANWELLRRGIALVGDAGEVDIGVLRDARREVANAALNAEDSFQRLISEHHGRPEALEPFMAFLVLTRRVAASTASLAIAADAGAHVPAPEIEPFARAAHDVLEDLAESLMTGRLPKAFPAPGTIHIPPGGIIHQKVTRIARQLKLYHDAVERMIPTITPSVVPGARDSAASA